MVKRMFMKGRRMGEGGKYGEGWCGRKGKRVWIAADVDEQKLR